MNVDDAALEAEARAFFNRSVVAETPEQLVLLLRQVRDATRADGKVCPRNLLKRWLNWIPAEDPDCEIGDQLTDETSAYLDDAPLDCGVFGEAGPCEHPFGHHLHLATRPDGSTLEWADPDPGSLGKENRWRVGAKLGRTIYCDNVVQGMLDSRKLAARVVELLNNAERRPARSEEKERIDKAIAEIEWPSGIYSPGVTRALSILRGGELPKSNDEKAIDVLREAHEALINEPGFDKPGGLILRAIRILRGKEPELIDYIQLIDKAIAEIEWPSGIYSPGVTRALSILRGGELPKSNDEKAIDVLREAHEALINEPGFDKPGGLILRAIRILRGKE